VTDLVFSDKKQELDTHGSWKILIVDDVSGVHSITKTVLKNLIYENRRLEFLSAYNHKEAEVLLQSHNDIALILLDVVMEEEDSGLKLVRFVRDDLGNPQVRIIIRTGHPGKAPPQKIIIDYDINDYEVKTDLTSLKLYTTVLASLRDYRDLKIFDITRVTQIRHQSALSRVSEASNMLFNSESLEELVSGVHREMLFLAGLYDMEKISSFTAIQDESGFRVREVHGIFKENEESDPEELIGKTQFASLRLLKKSNRNLLIQENAISLYEDARNLCFLIYLTGVSTLDLQERQLLDLFASNVSIASENLRLSSEISGTQEELIIKLSEVVETRSHDTAQHVKRVALLCELIAERIGMETELIHNLKLASAMHDIGKIGIPDEILLKPGILTPDEFSIVKLHPTIGNDLLKRSFRPLMRIAAQICLEHHEKVGGTGYPNGLSGGDISLNSRIVSICDVFDSITHGRQHRDPWDIERAADYLNSEKGKSFDPLLVDLFLENLEQVLQVNHDYPD